MSRFKTIEETVEAFYWTGSEDQTEDPVWFLEEFKKGGIIYERQFERNCKFTAQKGNTRR